MGNAHKDVLKILMLNHVLMLKFNFNAPLIKNYALFLYQI